jgi:ABC-type transporter Mla subunit MlaD
MLSIIQLFLPVTESFKLDVSQAIFYLLMLGMSLWSIYSLRKHANETSWEQKWTNHTSTMDDDIGVEHGSVVELCQVVATKPEQFAGILPGIMVTLGLLGTFVGLAQSLGQAAMTISSSMSQLAVPSSNYGGMERAFTGMIGMLQGMGTQFKTSIWGIIWFLVLRSIYGKLGFESKRLQWTISKMRLENQNKQDGENKRMTSLFNRVIHMLEQNNKSLGDLLNTQFASISDKIGTSIQSIVSMLENQSHKLITEREKSIVELQNTLISHSDTQFSSLQDSLTANNNALSQIIQNNTAALTSSSKSLQQAMEIKAESIVGIIQTQSNTAIETNENALNKLQQSLINTTGEQFTQLKADLSSNREKMEKAVLDNTKAVVNSLNDNKSALETKSQGIVDKIESQSNKLEAFSQACLTNFTDLLKHAQHTANNTEQFKTTIEKFTTDIQGSIDKISTAAGMVQDSATQLAEVVENLDAKIGNTLDKMASAISNTITTMNTSFNKNIEKTEAALTKSADGIAAQVQNMSKELGSKITTFDQAMESATKHLSVTINNMQDNIKEVLGSIKTEMSNTVKEMNDGFSENLKKNAEAFNKTVNNITSAVDKMSATMDTKLKEFSQMTSSSTEKLKETITEMRNNINAILTSLNNDVGATINKMNSLIDKSTKSLELSVKGISTAAATMEEQIKKSFVEFNNSMGTLIKRQDNSLKQFDASMTIVSENITEVTGEFKKLKEKLERSLSVVSSSNRELKNSLEIMDTIHKEYRELISSLDVAVNKMSKNLLVVTPNNSTTLKNN